MNRFFLPLLRFDSVTVLPETLLISPKILIKVSMNLSVNERFDPKNRFAYTSLSLDFECQCNDHVIRLYS